MGGYGLVVALVVLGAVLVVLGLGVRGFLSAYADVGDYLFRMGLLLVCFAFLVFGLARAFWRRWTREAAPPVGR